MASHPQKVRFVRGYDKPIHTLEQNRKSTQLCPAWYFPLNVGVFCLLWFMAVIVKQGFLKRRNLFFLQIHPDIWHISEISSQHPRFLELFWDFFFWEVLGASLIFFEGQEVPCGGGNQRNPWHAACPWWIGKDSGAKLPTAWCSKSSLENGNKKMEETNWWVLLAIFIWVSRRTLSLRIISAGGPPPNKSKLTVIPCRTAIQD